MIMIYYITNITKSITVPSKSWESTQYSLSSVQCKEKGGNLACSCAVWKWFFRLCPMNLPEPIDNKDITVINNCSILLSKWLLSKSHWCIKSHWITNHRMLFFMPAWVCNLFMCMACICRGLCFNCTKREHLLHKKCSVPNPVGSKCSPPCSQLGVKMFLLNIAKYTSFVSCYSS